MNEPTVDLGENWYQAARRYMEERDELLRERQIWFEQWNALKLQHDSYKAQVADLLQAAKNAGTGAIMTTKAMLAERVKSEWDEGGPPDGYGYWMQLKDGWTLDGASAIHEWTRKACLDRLQECRAEKGQS